MISYIFGDGDRKEGHEYYNGYKTIGQQYYMTLDSDNLQNVDGNGPQHAVMTSNCKFDVGSFNIWDFLTKKFSQKNADRYYLTEESCISPFWKPDTGYKAEPSASTDGEGSESSEDQQPVGWGQWFCEL